MKIVLLDHPWPLEAALNSGSILKRFNDWVRAHSGGVDPVPFISRLEYGALAEGMEHTSSNAVIFRVMPAYVRSRAGGTSATPVEGPKDLPLSWKQALREAMGDLRDWRNPQIVAVEERRDLWPKTAEIEIKLEESGLLEQRAFAILEKYDGHRYVTSDFDPWDLQRCHDAPTGSRLNEFPCFLPKHPDLEGLSFSELQQKLDILRRTGWHYRNRGEDRYCYIPPEGWEFTTISKEDWRNNCKTFPRDKSAGGKGSGPIDHWHRVWVWDRQKQTHWDVEFPTRNPEDRPKYWVVSHIGELIREGR